MLALFLKPGEKTPGGWIPPPFARPGTGDEASPMALSGFAMAEWPGQFSLRSFQKGLPQRLSWAGAQEIAQSQLGRWWQVVFLSGLLFGVLCTSMAVAASLMGGVVQVRKEKKDTFDFRAALYPLSMLMLCLSLRAPYAETPWYQIRVKHTCKISTENPLQGETIKNQEWKSVTWCTVIKFRSSFKIQIWEYMILK